MNNVSFLGVFTLISHQWIGVKKTILAHIKIDEGISNGLFI